MGILLQVKVITKTIFFNLNDNNFINFMQNTNKNTIVLLYFYYMMLIDLIPFLL